MRRAAVLALALVAAIPTAALYAQNPPGSGGNLPQCIDCGDEDPPNIWLNAPSGSVTTQYPYIDVYWCDNASLNASSRWLKMNGADVTASFTYTGTGDDCVAHATSSTTTVAVNVGSNSLEAHICDNWGWCETRTFTINRVSGPGAPTVALRNQNGSNVDRALCLTMGAGASAGLSCGDLFVVHAMPSYRTMGRDRSLTLFYSSATAAPRPVVAAAVTQPTSIQLPSSVYAELKVNNVVRASATYSTGSSGSTVQIALGYSASGDPSGIYPFTLEVRNVYNGSSNSTFRSGEILVVNRSTSEFGSGWSLAGVEQLVLAQSGSRILWFGADGSTAVYDSVALRTWVRAAGAFRDTLRYTPRSGQVAPYYLRTLRHGVQVKYDSLGHHWQTIARTGATTTFTWDTGSPPRLVTVTVPPKDTTATRYTLVWGGFGLLDKIIDPAGRVLDAWVSAGKLATLTDPDGVLVQFSYDNASRIVRRFDRRNYGTEFSYGNGLHVTRTAVPLAPGAAAPNDTARTTFQWWDERGLAIGVVTGTQTSWDTSSAYTIVDGPRTNVVDVASFWVDRWGAPTRIQDEAGGVTIVTRADPVVPALPTMMQGPTGQVWVMSYDSLGNLLSQSDTTHEGHGTTGLQWAKTRYTYRDAFDRWAPDSIIDPEGIITRMQYEALGPSIATAPNGHQTQFVYIQNGTLRGLVDSIVNVQVPTYTDTVNWGTTDTLRNQSSRFFYNALGNLDSARSPAGAVTRYAYNAATQVIRQVGPTFDTTVFFPRAIGVIDSVVQVDPAGPDRRYWVTYDSSFNRTSLIDPRGVTRTWRYDAAGRDTSEVDDYGVAERRRFGPSGLLDSVFTRASLWVIRTYDAVGRLVQLRYPQRPYGLGFWTPGDTINMTYDLAGHLLSASDHNGSVTRTYYREGTIKQDSQAMSFAPYLRLTHQFRYDHDDRRTWNHSFTTGASSDVMHVDYRYNLDQLFRIIIDYPGTTPATDTATYVWDTLGRRKQLITPHSATARWFYDLDGRLRRMYSTHTCVPYWNCGQDDLARVDRRYRAYDRAGRPRGMSLQVGVSAQWITDSVAYDAFGQMIMQIRNGRRRDYVYDLSGNLRRDSMGIYGHHMVVYNLHNRLEMDSASDAAGWHPRLTYGYSPAGERTGASTTPPGGVEGRGMGYDGLGRLGSYSTSAITSGFNAMFYSSWTAGDTIAVYNDTTYYVNQTYQTLADDCRYDALGRALRTCGGFPMLYDGQDADLVSDSRIVYGPGTDDPLVLYDPGGGAASLHYFLTDGGGRLLSYTDSSGNDRRGDGYNHIFAQRAVQSGVIINAETFGASRSETNGLPDVSFFRNRYFDQLSGRWLTQDPIGVAGGANLYQYVGNNPATFTDPFGLKPDSVYLQTHLVLLGASHASIRIVPEDQARYANDPRFQQGADGKWFTTIGAGPHQCFPKGLCLVSNRLRDRDAAPQGGTPINLGGRNENLIIEQMLTADARYADDLLYPLTAVPARDGGGYNSNSYISGLLAYLGISVTLPNVSLPGWNKPVPGGDFR